MIDVHVFSVDIRVSRSTLFNNEDHSMNSCQITKSIIKIYIFSGNIYIYTFDWNIKINEIITKTS